MAKSYYLSATDSDLTGGADFSAALATDTGGASSRSVTIAAGQTDVSMAWTPSGDPGTNGATGNHAVKLNLTTGNTSVQASIQLHRVNASGTVQASGSASAEQQATAGVKTFSVTNLDLGTWSAGDRLRVDYRFRSTAAHGNVSVTIGTDTADEEVSTPFTVELGEITGSGLAALTLGLVGGGGVEVAGAGEASLTLVSLGSGGVVVDGTGLAGLTLGMLGTGGEPALDPITGSGEAGLALGGAGEGAVSVGGDGLALLAVGMTGEGFLSVYGTGAIALTLGMLGGGVNDAEAPEPEPQTQKMQSRPLRIQRANAAPNCATIVTGEPLD